VPVDPPEVLDRFQGELRLVEAIARQLRHEVGEVLEIEELVSFGQEGLLKAARRYDPDRGIPFGKYAHHRIRGAMIDGMRSHGSLPRRAHEKLRVLQTANLMSSGFFEDNSAALHSGLSPEGADARMADQLATLATAMAVGFAGNDAEHQDGERVMVGGEQPDAKVERDELMEIVHAEMAVLLTEQEATFVRRHFFHDEHIDDIAADMGLSKSWGSRLMARGMEKLSRRLREVA